MLFSSEGSLNVSMLYLEILWLKKLYNFLETCCCVEELKVNINEMETRLWLLKQFSFLKI